MIFHFNAISILNWSAYLPKNSPYCQNNVSMPVLFAHKDELDTSMIPAQLRRRCSLASKIALSLASQACGQHQIDYGIFCSQLGELSHLLALFEQLQQQEILSPLRFSVSVHNTASGLFSINQKLNIPLTSIAAREQTFLAGMLEALTWLQLNPNKTVLLVMFDEALAALYQSLNIQYQHEYGVALLLSNKAQSQSPQLFLQLHSQAQIEKNTLPPALNFITWYLNPAAQAPLLQSMDTQVLSWAKHA